MSKTCLQCEKAQHINENPSKTNAHGGIPNRSTTRSNKTMQPIILYQVKSIIIKL